jgi:hypothetical protein
MGPKHCAAQQCVCGPDLYGDENKDRKLTNRPKTDENKNRKSLTQNPKGKTETEKC